MNNLRHYINGIRQGESYFSFERKFTVITYLLAAIHFAIAVIFAFFPIFSLVIINGCFAVFFVTIIRRMIKQGRHAFSFFACILEVIIISTFETMCMGMEAGFALYNISLISAIFYFTFVIDTFKKRETIPLIISIFATISYVSSYIFVNLLEPIYMDDIEQHVSLVRTLHLFNVIMTFAILIVFSFLFVWEIKANQGRLASQNEMLHEMAHKDPLTHLMNRRNMNTVLQQHMDLLKRTGQRFSLILGDIDDFKKVNDTYGHDAGDYVLVTVSDIITKSVREGDAVCRWGGEEILILIHGPLNTAANSAERIRANIAEADFVYEGQKIPLTMTFGVSESIPGLRIEDLVQKADDHLYTGKKSGKNIVVF